jgi:Rad3-related DNA helicase
MDLGLPPKFKTWRPGQMEAVSAGLDSNRRFVAHAMPTGSGKSLVYMAESLMRGCRACVLTATKGLQDQLLNDFGHCGLVTVKGRQNFDCVEAPHDRPRTCEDGPHLGCHESKKRREETECPYREQYYSAMDSQLVVTNYAYWCAINQYGDGLGEFDMLILDEAHDGPGFVCDAVNVYVTAYDVIRVLQTDWPRWPLNPKEWVAFARANVAKAQQLVTELATKMLLGQDGGPAAMDRLKSYKRLVSKLETLIKLRGQWVVDAVHGREDGYRIQLVWAREYAEEILFRGVPNIRLISATMTQKTLQMLGCGSDTFRFYDYDSFFPPERSPVWFIPTVKLNFKSDDADYWMLVERIDEILDGRPDRKGIIHTVSFSRAKRIQAASRHGRRMMLNDGSPGSAMEVVERYKASQEPVVLVTPSVSTGYDFPYGQCEFQIICKAPFPDLKSAVMKARMDKDTSYLSYEMAMTLIQSTGRGTRADDDHCENFIIDDTVQAAVNRFPGHYPNWWRGLAKHTVEVPPAPPSLIEDAMSGPDAPSPYSRDY